MKSKEYNKLVRDNIPKIIEGSGKSPKVIKVRGVELLMYLKSKLQEEVKEYLESEDVEELADIVEVIYSILHHKEVPQDELKKIITDKRADRGSFKEGYVLLNVVEEESEIGD